ncbi:MAG: di-trans,poly-cis-decaprenylcistransferase [Bdellovibrio sp. CG10_big_fil_rev_8_21_14_0_10_47_8]|nr:MAG: di-trans,poly-cis-decaprenylcistransferase [Bdellovibrio sp. CG10_big_fil_rev_8_21_14_0_10_47_8]
MSLPQHVAIIMDGNGRWAQQRNKPRTFGHIKGARIAKKIITACSDKGLKNLTLYAFSSENWLRPATEVLFLMNLLRRYLKKETENLVRQNIRFQTIGEIEKLPADIQTAIRYATDRTSKNTGLNLVFAISYGSRQEITTAVQRIAERIQQKELSVDQIDESLLHHELSTSSWPDPDLIIRTSGEHRLSNFLLWQAAYSEFYFCETLWPDFTVEDLEIALLNFIKRERRFGSISHHENTHH